MTSDSTVRPNSVELWLCRVQDYAEQLANRGLLALAGSAGGGEVLGIILAR